MRVTGQPVSKTSTGRWCAPNVEYAGQAHKAVPIERDEYERIDTISGELPPLR
jgi:hypothetical protein